MLDCLFGGVLVAEEQRTCLCRDDAHFLICSISPTAIQRGRLSQKDKIKNEKDRLGEQKKCYQHHLSHQQLYRFLFPARSHLTTLKVQ